ncbi:MAG TPA: ribonuclease E inhibitor RraB [Flavisolibacter sp.]|jgi:hypothetical protein|nr:ribonuclease E inhibitor RraB [Flavisolibacter sp.]
MQNKKQNTFFTEDVYNTEIGLDINKDVLERIYGSNITADDQLLIEFFFVSDNIDNILDLQNYLKESFSSYTQLKVQPYKNLFDLSGTTNPIQMDLNSVNEWNQVMWDLGYKYDCKLDGWQVGH